MLETRTAPRADYLARAEWNVRDTDATVIFTLAAKLRGGSKPTAEFAAKHAKPFIHLSQEADGAAVAATPISLGRRFLQPRWMRGELD